LASAAFAGGEVIHDLRTGRVFQLNHTAAQVWRELGSGADVGLVSRKLAQRYQVDLALARRDVDALLHDLHAAGITSPMAQILPPPRPPRVRRPPRSKPAWSAVCRVGEVPVRVVCHPATVAGSLALLTRRTVVRDVAETCLVLFRARDGFVLLQDGTPVGCQPNAASARWALLRQLVSIGRRRRWLALLHAAGVATPAGCLVLAGGSGSGKSTLLAGLLHAGHGFVADDILPLEAGTGLVWPVPLAVSIKQGSWPVVEQLFPGFERAPVVRFAERKLRYLWPASDAVALAHGTPAAALLFPATSRAYERR
jgi:hypothetical protein